MCLYLKQEVSGKRTNDGRQLHQCTLHEFCTKEGASGEFQSCQDCVDKFTGDELNLSSLFKDPLNVLDRTGHKTNSIRGMLAERPTFLVCGGPSAKSLPLELMKQRGIWSMGVNNMAGFVHTNSFVCSDPPSKFHHGIWLDPTVMKFVPIPKMKGGRARLREKVDKEFKPLQRQDKDVTVTDCPNIWGFERRSWLQPDNTFFTEKDAAWGNHSSGVSKTGNQKTVNTMFLGLRLLYYLGSRRIYLVGVDFGMDPMLGEVGVGNYAFDERRDGGAIGSNNAQYNVAADWLMKMQKDGVFSRFGLEVFNCNQFSRLRAFPYVPFEDAICDTAKDIPLEPFDLQDWYKK